jgi:hypothetical protein
VLLIPYVTLVVRDGASLCTPAWTQMVRRGSWYLFVLERGRGVVHCAVACYIHLQLLASAS